MDVRGRAAAAPDQHAGHRHLAVLLQRRLADRVQLRPRRHAAALCDERGRWRRAAHQLRRGPLCHAGVVAAWRLDRLHQDLRRAVSASASCVPTAAASACWPAGFLVEGPTWAPNGRVLACSSAGQPSGAGRRRGGDVASGRHHGPLRTSGANADRCFGSGLVTLDSAVAKDMIFLVGPSVFLALGSMLSGSAE